MFYKMVGSASSRHWNSAVSLLSGQNMGWTAASLDDIFDKFSFSQSWPMLVSLWPILIMILDADQSGFDLKAVAIITIIILQIILFIMIWVTWPCPFKTWRLSKWISRPANSTLHEMRWKKLQSYSRHSHSNHHRCHHYSSAPLHSEPT